MPSRDSRLGTRLRRGRGLGSRVAVFAAAVLLPNVLAGQTGDANGVPLLEAGKYRDERVAFNEAATAFSRGRIAMDERRADRAAEYFEMATRLDPASSLYFLWLGRAYSSQAQEANVFRQPGLAKKSRAAWEHAIELDPENLDARTDLMRYYERAPVLLGGSEEQAVEQAEEIRKRNALRGYLELGALYARANRIPEAERAYLAASKERSERHVGAYRLGLFYQDVGEFDKAFDVFESMIAANPMEVGALFQIGKTAAMSGQRLDRATEALESYLQTTPGRNDPSLAAAHWRLGMVHEKRQDRPRAKAEYESALRLDPTFRPASESLKKLT
jgi:tetratricopeptide (TPR) repeat protein